MDDQDCLGHFEVYEIPQGVKHRTAVLLLTNNTGFYIGFGSFSSIFPPKDLKVSSGFAFSC